MVRRHGDNATRRMRQGGRDVLPAPKEASFPLEPEAGDDEKGEATVVAAVPVLRLSAQDRDVLRTLQTGVVSLLRILSEARVDSVELAEELGDNVKSPLDAANWYLSKLRGFEGPR